MNYSVELMNVTKTRSLWVKVRIMIKQPPLARKYLVIRRFNVFLHFLRRSCSLSPAESKGKGSYSTEVTETIRWSLVFRRARHELLASRYGSKVLLQIISMIKLSNCFLEG